jgi:protein-tyrosine phosphatase
LSLPKEAQAALEREGVSGVQHKPQPLSEDLVKWADVIIGMEDLHRRAVVGRFPDAASKVRLLDPDGIPDPYGKSQEIYDSALAQIKRALLKLSQPSS